MNYVIVDHTGVVNTILWDGVSEIELPEGCVLFPYPTEVPRPPDTTSTTWSRIIGLVAGEPTVIWIEYPKTVEDIQAEADRAARETTRVAIRAIISGIKAEQDRAQTVLDNADSTPREKNLARSVKRIGAALIDLAKFVKDN